MNAATRDQDAPAPAPVAEDADHELDEADDSDDDSAAHRLKNHKNIPSWEETVGVVINANIENRSKGGRSRGRK